MNLAKKKILAARTLGVGKGRVVFNITRLDEIEEAITKQDIRDLKQRGAILIKEISGRRMKPTRKTRRRVGSMKKNVKTRKQEYMILVRKLRAYLRGALRRGEVTREQQIALRKQVKAKSFRSLAHLKEHLASDSGAEKKGSVQKAKGGKK